MLFSVTSDVIFYYVVKMALLCFSTVKLSILYFLKLVISILRRDNLILCKYPIPYLTSTSLASIHDSALSLSQV